MDKNKCPKTGNGRKVLKKGCFFRSCRQNQKSAKYFESITFFLNNILLKKGLGIFLCKYINACKYLHKKSKNKPIICV